MVDAGDRSTPLLDREWLSRLQDALAAADGLVVCFDFDGTLAPIVEDPADATMLPENRRLLRRLVDAPAITVAVVSGRSLDDLRDRVDVDGIHYAGNHGFEWETSDGRAIAEEARRAKRPLREAVERIRSELSAIPGCTIEDKGLTATVHYRRAPDAAIPTIVDRTESIVESIDGLACRHGKAAVGIHPDVPVGKDRIVERLADRRPGALVVFVGDDVTDEDGFRAAEPDGFGVLVGDRADTAASVRLPDPDGVTTLLTLLVAASAPATDQGRP